MQENMLVNPHLSCKEGEWILVSTCHIFLGGLRSLLFTSLIPLPLHSVINQLKKKKKNLINIGLFINLRNIVFYYFPLEIFYFNIFYRSKENIRSPIEHKAILFQQSHIVSNKQITHNTLKYNIHKIEVQLSTRPTLKYNIHTLKLVIIKKKLFVISPSVFPSSDNAIQSQIKQKKYIEYT